MLTNLAQYTIKPSVKQPVTTLYIANRVIPDRAVSYRVVTPLNLYLGDFGKQYGIISIRSEKRLVVSIKGNRWETTAPILPYTLPTMPQIDGVVPTQVLKSLTLTQTTQEKRK